MQLLVCQQMLADTTTWHRSWWTFTGCGCHNASNTNCPCSCIVASTEQRHDTWQSWQRPSAALSVVACGQRHLPISSCLCQLHVDQQSAIGRSPLLAREHGTGTVYLLLSAPLPHTTFSKKTLNLTFLDYHSHCDNCVFWLFIQRSCSSLYRLPRFINCPTYITLHFTFSFGLSSVWNRFENPI